MDYEYPFRPRGKHGFDRDDVINYITQAQLSCNEHLARMEELETAKNAWYTQAKNLEREKAALVARNRELEEQLGHMPTDRFQFRQPGDFPQDTLPREQEFQALKIRALDLEQELEAARDALISERETIAAMQNELQALREQQMPSEDAPQDSLSWEQEQAAGQDPAGDRIGELEQIRLGLERERAELANRVAFLESENALLLQSAAQLTEADAGAIDEARVECEALRQSIARLEGDIAGLANERAGLAESLAACETERAALAAAMAEHEENLSGVLARLAQSADQNGALGEEKEALAAQLTAARALEGTLAEQNTVLSRQVEELQRQLDTLARANAEFIRKEALALQEAARTAAESEELRARIVELERVSVHQNSETLRSMVLASFNYSDLYVGNNLKTAQIISDTTSQNINRVNDSAGSLLEQVEVISRSFNDATDTIRRNLATFQRELTGIQSGLNRRLSKDRFSALLEENERLRARMEQELLEELESDIESGILERPVESQDPTQLPFAEDLPPSYHSFLDDE